MPSTKKPRSGSMQFWPRKRVKRRTARVRSWADSKDAKLLGFAGYKVGMTHLIITDNRRTSTTKGMGVSCPATIIECPPIRIASIRFYKNSDLGKKLTYEVFSDNLDKELARAMILPKKIKATIDSVNDFDDITVLAYTNPSKTNVGRKKPEVLELGLGGSKDDKLAFAKDSLGKDFSVSDIFKEGSQLDFHVITKGKGYQGPVKRFGVSIRRHKSEKTKRGPGTLGGWISQGHFMYRVAHAGKMGYHMRTEYNKWLLKIGTKPEEATPKGGFLHYGNLKNPYIIVKGSIGGPAKRLVRFNAATRQNKKIPQEAPAVQYISTESKK